MKIQVISDLHLEHGAPFKFIKAEGADVLVLAGDIDSFDLALPFIKECASILPTIMILGNHEPMGHSIEETVDFWESVNIDNFHFLNNKTVEINGVHFIGSTLWSDLSADPINSFSITKTVADFKMIWDKDHINNVSISDLQREHDVAKSFIINELHKGYDKIVVVTHHLPTYQSISPKYINSSMNAAFVTNMDHIISSYSYDIDLWIHGHTHDCFDYMITPQTRVVCNPRGYPHEQNGFEPLKVVEI